MLSMKKARAIKHFGTGAALADALGIRPQAVSKWGDVIPEGRVRHIEKLMAAQKTVIAARFRRKVSQ